MSTSYRQIILLILLSCLYILCCEIFCAFCASLWQIPLVFYLCVLYMLCGLKFLYTLWLILKNKANFPLSFMSLIVFILMVYASSAPFRGYEKQSQSNPISLPRTNLLVS